MHTFLQDLRYAARQLWKSPGFTIAAVLTLTIGIGANTAIYSSMDAVVLHPLAVPQLDHVVTLGEQKDHGDDGLAMLPSVALANYADWKQQSRSFEDLAVRTSVDMSLTGAGDAAHVRTTLASANFFTVMRTQAVVGRVFGESECQPGRDSVAVLNYGFWERRFAGDIAVLGRKIELNQHEYTVVGVLPKTMQYPSDVDIFLPFAPTPQQWANRSGRDYQVTGRLREGVSVKGAQAEMRIFSVWPMPILPPTWGARSKWNRFWWASTDPIRRSITGWSWVLHFLCCWWCAPMWLTCNLHAASHGGRRLPCARLSAQVAAASFASC